MSKTHHAGRDLRGVGDSAVIFLGIADKTRTLTGDWVTQRRDIIGLRHAFLTYIVPVSLASFDVIVALRLPPKARSFHIGVRKPGGPELFGIDLSFGGEAIEVPSHGNAISTDTNEASFPANSHGWDIVPLKFDAVITDPGEYCVMLGSASEAEEMGRFWIIPLEAPPLTPERINAIKSDPQAVKRLRFVYGCKKCDATISIVAALDRAEPLGYGVWYADAPDAWRCSCNSTTLELRYFKAGVTGLLGMPAGIAGDVESTRMYELGGLERVLKEFHGVLDRDPPEEEVQNYLERHPVFWARFGAELIFAKRPILSFFKTDFAILTHKKELLLVEIEKPGLQIMKRDGGVSAQLQHALDQVHSWLHVIADHRIAVLTAFGLRAEDVASIRGIVVAGRNQPYSAEALRSLRNRNFGSVEVMTFDDLSRSLVAVLKELRQL